MNLISSFENIAQANECYNNSFESEYLLELNPWAYYCISNNIHDAFSDPNVSPRSYLESLENPPTVDDITPYIVEGSKYYYIGSKTNFRNTVYRGMTDSLYKKFYKALKDNGYIFVANGNYVVLEKKNITPTLYSQVESEKVDVSALSSIVKSYEELESDKKFYEKVYTELLEEMQEVKEELRAIKRELNNNQMTYWG